MLHKGIRKIPPELSELVHEWSEFLHELSDRIHEQNIVGSIWFFALMQTFFIFEVK